MGIRGDLFLLNIDGIASIDSEEVTPAGKDLRLPTKGSFRLENRACYTMERFYASPLA